MRRLLLLRHAKSSWDDPTLADFDRPLATRGMKAARLMGAEMARRGWIADLALVSTSVRTRQTWELVAAQWPAPPCEARFTDTIYEAHPRDLLAEIRKTGDGVRRLLVVGHNPGLEMLTREIAGPDSDPAAMQRLAAKFPTAALAGLEVEGAWCNLGERSARLTDFLRPRDLD
ncbi:SixA phosphatase family protein [Mesorhizobium sp. PUT5]|uniref:SixA phosphatase family protein n=1 Tax=Mesorhizobium sp. PUT5 TaxID=3454629 RepID=UPI003FA4D443